MKRCCDIKLSAVDEKSVSLMRTGVEFKTITQRSGDSRAKYYGDRQTVQAKLDGRT